MHLKMFALLVYWKLNDVLTEEATIWKELYKRTAGEWFCVVFLMVLISAFYFDCLAAGWSAGICMFSQLQGSFTKSSWGGLSLHHRGYYSAFTRNSSLY